MDDAQEAALPAAICYGPQGWQPLETNPLFEVIGTSADEEEALGKLGFAVWSGIGRGDRSPIGFTIFHRPGPAPQFAIAVFANDGSAVEHVYARDLPSLMLLLERWVPVARAATVANLLAEIPNEEPILRELLLEWRASAS